MIKNEEDDNNISTSNKNHNNNKKPPQLYVQRFIIHIESSSLILS